MRKKDKVFVPWMFFLPEFNRFDDGSRELFVETRGLTVEDELALNLDPVFSYVFHDLLQIRAQYFFWSECNSDYDNERNLFMSKYRDKINFLVKKREIPPDYRDFLYEIFDEMVGKYIKKFFDNFDVYFWNEKWSREFDFKMPEWGFVSMEFASFEEFKEKLIWICRGRFPEAGKKNNYLLRSKTFMTNIRKNFIKYFDVRLKNLLNSEIKEKKIFLRPYILNLKEKLRLELFDVFAHWIFANTSKMDRISRDVMLLEKGDCNVFYEIECMLNVLHILNCEVESGDFLLRYLQVVFSEIMNEFEKSERLKSVDRWSKRVVPSRVVPVSGSIDTCTVMDKVSSEEKEYIEKIVELLKLDDKKRKEFVKYLTRLVANWKDIRVSVLEWQYWIRKIPKEVNDLFNSLSVEVIDDFISDNDESHIESVLSDIPFISWPALNQCWLAEESDLLNENFEDDPFTLLLTFSEKNNYKIRNERKLQKQINSICVDDRLRKLMCSLVKSVKFWQPDKKYSPRGITFYSLRVWWNTWYTLLFSKDKNWGFIIEWFFTHDDYIDRIKNLR